MLFWSPFEQIPGPIALPVVWQKHLGEHLAAVRALCLQPASYLAQSFPCPRECGCWHQVVRRGPEEIVAVCGCAPPHCEPLRLTLAEITPLELNWNKLGRALCRALGCEPKNARLSPHTLQFGAWSAEAVPLLLTIPSEPQGLRHVIAEQHLRLRCPFILFAPTAAQFDASVQEVLADAGAGFFPLEGTFALAPNGVLHALKPPGELFARFTPQPKELELDVAQRAFALVRQLETESRLKPPSLLTVLRLYCLEERSVAQVAARCGCGKATIIARLRLIRERTGVRPAELRRLSVHLDHLEEQLADPRARGRLRVEG